MKSNKPVPKAQVRMSSTTFLLGFAAEGLESCCDEIRVHCFFLPVRGTIFDARASVSAKSLS